MATAKQRRRQAKRRQQGAGGVASSDTGTSVPAADWDAPEAFPDSGAPPPPAPDEPIAGPVLATTPARRGPINVVLIVAVTAALAYFLFFLLRG